MIGLPRLYLPEAMSRLRSYVSRMEYGSGLPAHKPRWDAIPGEADEVGDDSGW